MSLLKKYLYVDLDKLFLKEQHAFPLKVRPTNLQAHIDKLSIKIKRRVVNGQTFSFHSLYSSFKFHDNVNVSALIIGNWLLELCLLFQFHHGIIIWLLFDFVPLVPKLLDLIIIWLKTNITFTLEVPIFKIKLLLFPVPKNCCVTIQVIWSNLLTDFDCFNGSHINFLAIRAKVQWVPEFPGMFRFWEGFGIFLPKLLLAPWGIISSSPLNKPRCHTGWPGIVIVRLPGGYPLSDPIVISSFSLFSCANWKSRAWVRDFLSGSLLWNSSTSFWQNLPPLFSPYHLILGCCHQDKYTSTEWIKHLHIQKKTSMFVLFMFILY